MVTEQGHELVVDFVEGDFPDVERLDELEQLRVLRQRVEMLETIYNLF